MLPGTGTFGVREGARQRRQDSLHELLCQALEAALGSIQVRRTAQACASDERLLEEWEQQRKRHELRARVLRHALEELGLDADEEVPGRLSIRHIFQSLVRAMQMALVAGDPSSTQRVAAGCVLLVEAQDSLSWELIGQYAMKAEGRRAQTLGAAWDRTQDDEESCQSVSLDRLRELWLDELGLSTVVLFSERAEARALAQGKCRRS